jgi:hypothetical protein
LNAPQAEEFTQEQLAIIEETVIIETTPEEDVEFLVG